MVKVKMVTEMVEKVRVVNKNQMEDNMKMVVSRIDLEIAEYHFEMMGMDKMQKVEYLVPFLLMGFVFH